MFREMADEIYSEIKLRNAETKHESVIHSDEFEKYLSATLGIEIEAVRKLIKILTNAHKIFTIEIIAEDKKRNIPRVEGYVECDLNTIRRLKNYYQHELIKLFEVEFKRPAGYHQIVKEIIPMMSFLNSTTLGQVANKAIMMGELERLLEKKYEEYTDKWKEKQFVLELQKSEKESAKESATKDGADSNNTDSESLSAKKLRAVDSKLYEDFVSKSKSYPLDRILKIYGIDFFLRVHLRRNMFDYLTQIVDIGNVFNKNDLVRLRNLLNKVKININKDKALAVYRNEIYSLERSITHFLYFGDKFKED